MTITFTSNIKNQDETNKIEFTTPVVISEINEFKVFEFVEPQNNVSNRIEVSNKVVNIFAGPSTIVLSLDELIANDYNTPGGTIMFDSEMKELVIKEDEIMFEYTLGQVNNPFGDFKINLKINK